MSLFLEVKNIVTIKKGAMDTERTARKLCRLVCIGEESCFAACSKTKPPGPWIDPSLESPQAFHLEQALGQD